MTTTHTSHRPPSRLAPRRGLTIVEAAVSVVIVAVLLVAALGTLGAAAKARTIQAAQCQAPALARLLMSEIRQCRYTDDVVALGPLGPETGEVSGKDRSAFDDVDDYEGLDEASPRAHDGASLPGTGNFRSQVRVEWVRPDQPDVIATTDSGLKRITVTVTGPASKATLVALQSRYGSFEQASRVRIRTTYVTGVAVELKMDAEGSRIYSATTVSNQVAVP